MRHGAWPLAAAGAAACRTAARGDASPSPSLHLSSHHVHLQSYGGRCRVMCSSMSRAAVRSCCLCGGRSCGTACRSEASPTRSRCTCRRSSARQRRSRSAHGSMLHLQVDLQASQRRLAQPQAPHRRQRQQQQQGQPPTCRTRHTACRPGLGWGRFCCSPQTATRGGCWRQRWVLQGWCLFRISHEI